MFQPSRLVLLAVSIALVGGCSSSRDPWQGVPEGRLKVLTSFPPLYCFAAKVAGEHAEVVCLLTSKGPHHYSATAQDSLKVAGADLFILNGLELDGFATRAVTNSGNRKKDLIFKVGDAIAADNHDLLIHLDEEDRKHVHEDGTECVHGEHDPHLWLGADPAIAMVQHIAQKLGSVDPANQAAYEKNAEAYIKEIEELRDYGLAKFKEKKQRGIITTHDSLRYFAQTYELEVAGNIQPQPGMEAAAGQLAKLAKLCKEQNVGAIVIEPQYSTKGAESLRKHLLAQEKLDIPLVRFDPMETAPAARGGNPDPDLYIKTMRQNIDQLAKALK